MGKIACWAGVGISMILSVSAVLLAVGSKSESKRTEQEIIAEVDRRIAELTAKQQMKNDAFVDFNNAIGQHVQNLVIRVGNIEGRNIVNDLLRDDESSREPSAVE